jgi:hypothetical protein
MYARADPLGSPPLVLEAEDARNVNKPVAVAPAAAAPLRGELENRPAALLPAAEDAQEEPGLAVAAADVDEFGSLGPPGTKPFGRYVKSHQEPCLQALC